ncbi:MAG: L,D-transpeptidase family protein [Rhodospirillales bacterium]
MQAIFKFTRILAIAGLALVASLALAQPAAADLAQRIKFMVAADGPPRTIDAEQLDIAALKRFYEPRDFAPAWIAGDVVLDRDALLAAVEQADMHGLDPADYHLAALRARSGSKDEMLQAEYEVLLSDTFLRYATHMRMGRVRLSSVEADWSVQPTPFDAVAALAKVAGKDDFRALLAALPPSRPDYARLVQTLKLWRDGVAADPWPSVMPGAAIKKGATDDRLLAVRQRLIADGDLTADQAEGNVLDEKLTAALKKFQMRYGLDPDGLVGGRTMLVMNTSRATRVQQLLATLERLRSLPRDLPSTAIFVNVAANEAEMLEDGQPVFTARVIVGTADHPTPVVAARFSSLQLNPPWTIPNSIATKEILPHLQRDPSYLAKQNMVILNRDDDPQGLALDWTRYTKNYFPFVLRQLAGPATALGLVVFEMPNKFDVYLHDTPDRRLFALGDRFFSHGCVRVENPRVLASYLLRNNPQWTAQALDDAIATGETQRIMLAKSVPIFLFYQTVYVGRDDQVHFRDDTYGRDWRLNVAVAKLREGVLPADQMMFAPPPPSADAGKPSTEGAKPGAAVGKTGVSVGAR